MKTLKNVIAIETPLGLCKLKDLDEYNKEVIEKVKSMLLNYTESDSRDNTTFILRTNFKVIQEELNNLLGVTL